MADVLWSLNRKTNLDDPQFDSSKLRIRDFMELKRCLIQSAEGIRLNNHEV
jgi:hypothetical protein